jgi:hypothetical protein
MEHPETCLVCLQLDEWHAVTTTIRKAANSMPMGAEKLRLMGINITLLNQIEQDSKHD